MREQPPHRTDEPDHPQEAAGRPENRTPLPGRSLTGASQWLRPVAVALVVALLVIGFGPAAAAVDGASGEQLDVVFLIDRSPSMADQADTTADLAVRFARELEDRGADAQYSVVAYANPRWTTLELAPTSDRERLAGSLDGIEYSQNSTENASGAFLAALDDDVAFDLPLRPDATTLLVVVTDEDDDGYCSVGQRALGAIDGDGARLVALATDPPNAPEGPGAPCLTDPERNDLRHIAEDQVEHGHWVDPTDPDFGSVLDAMGVVATPTPTPSPTPSPTASPTPTPTSSPTPSPTASPTETPASSPTPSPTASPTPSDTSSSNPSVNLAPEFELVNASVNRSQLEAGEPLGVVAVFENVGTAEGSLSVALEAGPESYGTREARIEAGETRRFAWTLTPTEPGTLALTVEGYDAGTVTVVEPTPTATAEATSPPDTADGSSTSGTSTGDGAGSSTATDQPDDSSAPVGTSPAPTGVGLSLGGGLGLAALGGGAVLVVGLELVRRRFE